MVSKPNLFPVPLWPLLRQLASCSWRGDGEEGSLGLWAVASVTFLCTFVIWSQNSRGTGWSLSCELGRWRQADTVGCRADRGTQCASPADLSWGRNRKQTWKSECKSEHSFFQNQSHYPAIIAQGMACWRSCPSEAISFISNDRPVKYLHVCGSILTACWQQLGHLWVFQSTCRGKPGRSEQLS